MIVVVVAAAAAIAIVFYSFHFGSVTKYGKLRDLSFDIFNEKKIVTWVKDCVF